MPSPSFPTLLNVPTAARLAAVRPDLILKQIRAGRIPATKIGREYRIPARAFCAAYKIDPSDAARALSVRRIELPANESAIAFLKLVAELARKYGVPLDAGDEATNGVVDASANV